MFINGEHDCPSETSFELLKQFGQVEEDVVLTFLRNLIEEYHKQVNTSLERVLDNNYWYSFQEHHENCLKWVGYIEKYFTNPDLPPSKIVKIRDHVTRFLRTQRQYYEPLVNRGDKGLTEPSSYLKHRLMIHFNVRIGNNGKPGQSINIGISEGRFNRYLADNPVEFIQDVLIESLKLDYHLEDARKWLSDAGALLCKCNAMNGFGPDNTYHTYMEVVIPHLLSLDQSQLDDRLNKLTSEAGYRIIRNLVDKHYPETRIPY